MCTSMYYCTCVCERERETEFVCVKNRCTGEVGTYVVEMCSSKITSFGVYVDTDVDSRNVITTHSFPLTSHRLTVVNIP
jgi:hypothetical protein